jgi:hypothetical protein
MHRGDTRCASARNIPAPVPQPPGRPPSGRSAHRCRDGNTPCTRGPSPCPGRRAAPLLRGKPEPHAPETHPCARQFPPNPSPSHPSRNETLVRRPCQRRLLASPMLRGIVSGVVERDGRETPRASQRRLGRAPGKPRQQPCTIPATRPRRAGTLPSRATPHAPWRTGRRTRASRHTVRQTPARTPCTRNNRTATVPAGRCAARATPHAPVRAAAARRRSR